MNLKPILFSICLLPLAQSNAQTGTLADGSGAGVYNPGYPNEAFVREKAGGKRPIVYTSLRESDVSWEKRVWREIDMREKQNFPLYFPVETTRSRTSLFQTLTQNILRGNIIAFSDEEFLMPIERSVIRNKLVACDSVDKVYYTPDGTPYTIRELVCDSSSIYREVLKYRVKEDWFFDKQKSTLEVRIIGIAAYRYIEEKEAYQELFWVYFPACRPYLAQSEVYNVKNDSERMSYDDLFWKRQFASTVVKESNVYDRAINEYEKGIGSLLESDRVKNDIFRWEHDLWHF